MANADGTPTWSVGGTEWEIVEPSPISNTDAGLRLKLPGRTTGRKDFTVVVRDTPGAEARLSGFVQVNSDAPPPLSLDDVRITAKEGDPYVGGLTARGGPDGTPSYALQGVPEEEIGLSLESAESGDFAGTAPSDGAGTYSYGATVSKGGETASATVTVIIQDVVTPPPVTTSCSASSVSGTAGSMVTAPVLTCATDTSSLQLLPGRATGPSSWMPAWTDPVELTPAVPPAVQGSWNFNFSATIPSGTAAGTVQSFTNVVRDGSGVDTTVTVTVTVVADGVPPIELHPDQRKLDGYRTSTLRRRLRPTGGPAAGNYTFRRASGPSWLIISSLGNITIHPRPADVENEPWSVTVTKGAASRTFPGTIKLYGRGAVNPGDEDTEI